jgi:hypothetical protein
MELRFDSDHKLWHYILSFGDVSIDSNPKFTDDIIRPSNIDIYRRLRDPAASSAITTNSMGFVA